MAETTPPTQPGKPASGHDKIKGVFSSQSVTVIGTGSTQRKTIQKTFWLASEQPDGNLEIQPLNTNYVPSGVKKTVEREEFLRKFSPEPEFYVSTVFPKMQELQATIVRGEQHRERGELYSAEFEFTSAVKVDEENVRANFGLGLTYLDRGERNKANDIFERLVKLEAAFDAEHKHLFNDFGISLRKNHMLEQAVGYYSRALELTENDDHLHLNVARALYEKGEIEPCLKHLRDCARLNPDLAESRKFWNYLKRRGLTSEDYPGGPAKAGTGTESDDEAFEPEAPTNTPVNFEL
jgi:tetratricopeptide (TPR) repeat protein